MSRLSQIEQRLAAATPGPWTVNVERWHTEIRGGATRFGPALVARTPHSSDADLIAHAPADLAALVKFAREVERMHQPRLVICLNPTHGDGCDGKVCDPCDVAWPCPTAAAVQRLGGA